jgi:CheY-like chemotaxis protein
MVILHDGQEALDYLFPELSFEPPDFPCLILLDLRLPLGDGYTVLERVKRDERTQHIPMIILTTMDEPAEVERCYALGCNVYITKPVEETRFIEALRQLGLSMSIVQLPQVSCLRLPTEGDHERKSATRHHLSLCLHHPMLAAAMVDGEINLVPSPPFCVSV